MAYNAEGESESLESVSAEVESVSGKAEPSVHVDTVECQPDHDKGDASELCGPAQTSSPTVSTHRSQTQDVSSGLSKKRPVLTRTRKG